MTSPRTVAVTGANRGIGMALALTLAAAGCRVVALCRTDAAAAATAQAIAAAHPDAPAAVAVGGAEVTSLEAMVQAAAEVRGRCPAGLDVLVCNAGVWVREAPARGDIAAQTIAINYFGVRNTCDAFVPLLARDARVVHVSSRMGYLSNVPSPTERAALLATADIAAVDAFARRYVDIAKAEGEEAMRPVWGELPYAVSKILLNRLAELQAALAAAGALPCLEPGVRPSVVTCSPGYCRTEMTRGGGSRSAEEGAADVAYLCLAAGAEWAAVMEHLGCFFSGKDMEPWRTAVFGNVAAVLASST